jgi:eukaryotic-like serine/threonine-protein kinase
VLVAGGLAVWRLSTGDGADPAADRPNAASSGAAPGAGAGFVPCDAGFCPAAPLCWGGLNSISGKAMPPGRADCADTHDWETFAAIRLPADATEVRQDELMARADIAAACSESVLARRSQDPDATAGWVRDAWPIQIPGTGDRLLHCLARPADGASAGPAFRTS